MPLVGRMPTGHHNANAVGLASGLVSMLSDDIGRRIRAAFVLAGKAPRDVAPELNVSLRTLDRVIAGDRQPREWELRRLAEILGALLVSNRRTSGRARPGWRLHW